MQLDATVIATWPAANYINPVTRGPGSIITSGLLYPLVLLVISIRIYTRLRITRSFGADDWLILAALVPATAFVITAFLAEFKFDWNRHAWDVELPKLLLGLKLLPVTQAIFCLCITFTKLSMLTMTYRIMAKGNSRRFRRLTVTACVVVAVDCVIFITVVIFQCRPPSHYWTLTFDAQPECINQDVHILAAGIINTATDLLVVIFPIPAVLKLQIPPKQQRAILALFCAGALVCIAGSVRIYFDWIELGTMDLTWESYGVWITSAIELYVGMIGASVPTLKPFFKLYIPRLLDGDTTHHSSGHRSVREKSSLSPRTNSSSALSGAYIDLELGAMAPAALKRSTSTPESPPSSFGGRTTQQRFSTAHTPLRPRTISPSPPYSAEMKAAMDSQEELVVAAPASAAFAHARRRPESPLRANLCVLFPTQSRPFAGWPERHSLATSIREFR